MDRMFEQLTVFDAFMLSKVMGNHKLAKRLLEPLIGCKVKDVVCVGRNIVERDDGKKGICLEVSTFGGKSKKMMLHLFLYAEDIFGAGRGVYRFEEQCVEEPGIVLDKGFMQIFVCATAETAEKERNEEIQAFLYYLLNPGEKRNNCIKMLNDELRRVRQNTQYKKEFRHYIQEETEASQRHYARSLLAEKRR